MTSDHEYKSHSSDAITSKQDHSILQRLAHRVMTEKGLVPDFSAQVLAEVDVIHGPATESDKSIRDLKSLPWCSIDNDDSRDLDQLSVAVPIPGDATKLLVAIADVDALVKKGSAIDEHARQNTTSVYTAAVTFPMLPEKLSTDLTSLNFGEDRLAIVVELVFSAEGKLTQSDVYRALVHNHAKLAYNSVAAWLEGQSPAPQPITAVPGLEENLRIQDRITQTLKEVRHERGALELETIQTRPVFAGEALQELKAEAGNRAKDVIAELMIASNGVVARYLASHGYPSLRRVVRVPKRWDRIVELATEWGSSLPKLPDARALEDFLLWARTRDPMRFPDLSLSVVKLLGPGEYVAQFSTSPIAAHFGLAVGDYTHSTAPNRRYPDLITQRLIKAALTNSSSPYSDEELESLAAQCTESENIAKHVERQLRKSAAALLLESRIGDTFDAIVTGSTEKGTWVRILHPPIEGRLLTSREGIDVGHRLRVQLTSTNVEMGFIDFRRAR